MSEVAARKLVEKVSMVWAAQLLRRCPRLLAIRQVLEGIKTHQLLIVRYEKKLIYNIVQSNTNDTSKNFIEYGVNKYP